MKVKNLIIGFVAIAIIVFILLSIAKNKAVEVEGSIQNGCFITKGGESYDLNYEKSYNGFKAKAILTENGNTKTLSDVTIYK